MSAKESVGEEPQTPDNPQSGFNPGTPRPSTSRLSAEVPEFVPSPRRPGFAGTPHPAMRSVRELTAHEAAAEMRAWYDDPEGAYPTTASTWLPGTQYGNGLPQASEGPYMHRGYANYYYCPSQPGYPVSQYNTGYQTPYASVNRANFPPSTPARQMWTGPEGVASSAPRQETRPRDYSRPSAPPQTPLNRSGGAGFPANANQSYQAVPQHTPTPFHAQHAGGVYPSTVAPGDLSSSSYAQWLNSNDRQGAPAQHAASGAAVHPSALPLRGVPNDSTVRQAHPSIRGRAPVQHTPSGAAAHSSDLAPRGVPYDSSVRRGHPSIRRRGRARHVPSGAATHSSPLASRNVPYDSPVRQPYPSDQQRTHTQYPPSGFPDRFAALDPRNVLTGSPVRQARPFDQQRVCTPYPSPGLPVPFPAFAQGSISSTSFEQWAASTGQRRMPVQHTEAVPAPSYSTLTSEYMPPPAFAQQAHPTDRQRVPAQPAAAELRAPSSNFAPGTTPASNFAPQAHSTGHQGTYPAGLQDPFIATTSSPATNINVPRPAPPTWPGHENFTMDEVEAFIKKVEIENWLRQTRHHQMLAQLNASNLERPASETLTPKQRATATEQSGTAITEAAQRALEQRLADRLRRERVDERERARQGIPDPQEGADRARFERIMETYNYQNYSREPVNPRLPHAHIVASDPARQQLVSVLETVFSNMSLYRRGYAPFPGSLYSQTDESFTGQASTGQPSPRPGMGQTTDSIPDGSDSAIRNDPEIRRDSLNDSTFIPFMDPAGQDGNLRMPHDNPELPVSDTNTTSSSGDTSTTPMDTPSQSEYTPTESTSDEGRIPQSTAPAVTASEQEKTPQASAHAVPVSEQEKTPRTSAHAVPVSAHETTPRASVRAVPTSEQEKTPGASIRPVQVSEQTPQPPFRVVDKPSTTPSPLIGAAFGGTDADMPRRRRASRSASRSAPKKSPQPSASAAPASEKKTTSPAPVPAACTSSEENAPQLRTPQGRPDSKMPAVVGLTGPALSRGSTAPPDATIPTSGINEPAVTYANILAGLVRAPRPVSAAQNPGNAGDVLRDTAAMAATYPSMEGQLPLLADGYPPFQPWFRYGYVGQTPVLRYFPGVQECRATIVPAPTIDQPGAAGVLAQDTPSEGTRGETDGPPTRQSRRRRKQRRRKAPKLDEAAPQQDRDAPKEGDSLLTEAQ